jgi:RND family efflux transporter MFP subunit
MPESKGGWGVLVGVALIVTLFVIGIAPRVRDNAERGAATTEPDAGLVPVSIVMPRRADGPHELLLPSNIQAIEEAAIYARSNGYVRERYVDIGDRVAVGAVLALIDTPELDKELSQARATLAQTRAGLAQVQASLGQAQANLMEARASLQLSIANMELARVSADRFTRLEQEDAVARQDADERRTAFAVAQARTAAAQANVDAMQANIGSLEASVAAARANVAANEANVERQSALQSFQRVQAPFGGIITARGIDRGALITAGNGGGSAPLFRIARIDQLRIFVNVPQAVVRSIARGQAAEVLVPEFPRRRFAGKVESTAGALDPTSRTLLTEVRLQNADGALMPGMYAQVKFAVVSPAPALLVPATTLVIGGDGAKVMVVRDDHTVQSQTVELGRDLGQNVEIVSGLAGTERLVVNPPDGLKDGDRIVLGAENPK